MPAQEVDATLVVADGVTTRPLSTTDLQTDGLTDAELRASAVVVDDTPAGTWNYAAGASGSRSVTGRVLSIAAVATADGASVSINGGDAIPVPTDIGLTLEPHRALVDPTIVFTGTASYVVEFVA